jgi:hypothetical protein
MATIQKTSLVYLTIFSKDTTASLRNRLDFFLGMLFLQDLKTNEEPFYQIFICMNWRTKDILSAKQWSWIWLTAKHIRKARFKLDLVIRHKNVELCPVGALALYLFSRFHIAGEPFPNMSSRTSWYNIPLLRGSGNNAITYQQQLRGIKECYQNLNNLSSKKTHSMRDVSEYWWMFYQSVSPFRRCP